MGDRTGEADPLQVEGGRLKVGSPAVRFGFNQGFIRGHAGPPGWKPQLYVSQDG